MVRLRPKQGLFISRSRKIQIKQADTLGIGLRSGWLSPKKELDVYLKLVIPDQD